MSGLWLDGAPTTGLQAFKGRSIVTARSQDSRWSSQPWNLLVRHVFFSQEQITLQAKMFQVHQAIRHTMPVCFSGTPGQPVAPLPHLLSTSLRAWKQPCSLVAGRVLHSCCSSVLWFWRPAAFQRTCGLFANSVGTLNPLRNRKCHLQQLLMLYEEERYITVNFHQSIVTVFPWMDATLNNA